MGTRRYIYSLPSLSSSWYFCTLLRTYGHTFDNCCWDVRTIVKWKLTLEILLVIKNHFSVELNFWYFFETFYDFLLIYYFRTLKFYYFSNILLQYTLQWWSSSRRSNLSGPWVRAHFFRAFNFFSHFYSQIWFYSWLSLLYPYLFSSHLLIKFNEYSHRQII